MVTMKTNTIAGYARPPEAAEFLRISRRYLHRLTKAGVLPAIRLGSRCVLYDLNDVAKALNRFKD
jgi:excisionase family DNA binding protein